MGADVATVAGTGQGGRPGCDGALDLFDQPGLWRAEAIHRLRLHGTERMAGASPGAGYPSVLQWLVDGLGLRVGCVVADVGGGLGGASAWLSAVSGATVIVVELVDGSARSARRLFPELVVLQGSGAAIPLASGSVDAVCLLGVSSLVDDLAPVLSEVRRLLRVGGRVGLSDLVDTRAAVSRRGPNTFRSITQFGRELEAVGLATVAAAVGEVASASWWQGAAHRVEASMRAGHGHDPAFARWQADSSQLGSLKANGALAMGCIIGERSALPGRRDRPVGRS